MARILKEVSLRPKPPPSRTAAGKRGFGIQWIGGSMASDQYSASSSCGASPRPSGPPRPGSEATSCSEGRVPTLNIPGDTDCRRRDHYPSLTAPLASQHPVEPPSSRKAPQDPQEALQAGDPRLRPLGAGAPAVRPAAWRTPAYDRGRRGVAALSHTFFDWNEIRGHASAGAWPR